MWRTTPAWCALLLLVGCATEDRTFQPVKLTAEEAADVEPGWFSLALVTVRDPERKVGLRTEDSDAYFELLGMADRLSPELAKKAALAFETVRRENLVDFEDRPAGEFPTFYDLAKHPEEYVGRLITLKGRIRMINEFSPRDRRPGFERLYQVVFFPYDSDHNPALVICKEIPEDLPRGEVDIEHVEITGFFLKLMGYFTQKKWQDGRRIGQLAPLILAQPPVIHPAPDRGTVPAWFWWTLGGVVLALLIGFGWFTRHERQRREARRRERLEKTEPEF